MIRSGIGRGGRLAAAALAVGLALSLAGDGGRAATVPAAIQGQDPLEVLALKVRPNVIIVLDSSGSMTSRVPGGDTFSGDHPRSRMYQGKEVIRNVVAQNDDKASFMFGTYTQVGSEMGNLDAGDARFQYYTSSDLSPSMLTNEILILGARGDGANNFNITNITHPTGWNRNTGTVTTATAHGLSNWQTVAIQGANEDGYNGVYQVTNVLNTTQFQIQVDGSLPTPATGTITGWPNPRGFQSWQWIDTRWNTVYFSTCQATVPAGFYQTGDSLAAALQSAMNATSCGSSYTVTYDEGNGRFDFNTAIDWSNRPNSIAESLGGSGWNNSISGTPHTLLLRAEGGRSGWVDLQFSETIDGINVQFYQVRAGRLWNGETLQVQADGAICDLDFGDATTRTSPPSFTMQVVNDNCGAPTGQTAVFTYAGADFGGNDVSCRGYMPQVGIVPCDLSPPPTQIETMTPFLDLELPFDPDGSAQNYTEVMDGSWATDVAPTSTQGGAKADGWTPIANSLIDIKGDPSGEPSGGCIDIKDSDNDGRTDDIVDPCPQRNFLQWWELGPDLGDPTTNPAWASVSPPEQRAIKNHLDPKEKTIVLFVTDGDDTCPARADGSNNRNGDNDALRAAYYAERLYERIDSDEPASSVQTYVIGFGGAFVGGEPTRLNWIAWGGSGLGQGLSGQPDVPTTTASDGGRRWSGTADSLKALRAQCSSCEDAFVAPDAATLAAQLQAIIDQGASSGEFTAQQSITESVYEYVDRAGFDARSPTERYDGIVPTRFISSFTLPGFRGQLKAYQNAGDIDGDGVDDVVQRWSAGDELFNLVSGGMTACDSSAVGGGLGECVFTELHGGATDASVATSTAAIKRRVYTTSRNGVYSFTPASLMARTASDRVALWPPDPGVAPGDYTSMGTFDEAMGLPSNSPSCTLNGYPSCEEQLFAEMQAAFGACVGPNLPGACTTASALTRMQAARREARDIILAFMAGAETVPAAPNGIARTSDTRSLLFKARSWMLADSEFATAAVVAPPLQAEPEATGSWVDEYQLFRDGVRDGTTGQITQGFGLRSPDDDGTAGTGNDTRTDLKPVMTVLYAPGNDMLHAFRAGPNVSPSSSCSATDECGGEELWGFVPFDQLEALRLRVIHHPQGRDNHVYMIARGVRFADVFVPTPSASPMTNVSIGSVTVPQMEGVWRRILYFGRGIGGKYVTALDVTAPGPYTANALETTGPIPLWSRGNPDTQDGTATGPDNNPLSPTDRLAYARMGETWSMPAVAFVESTKPIYVTDRSSPDPVKYVLAMGSGYGETSIEGSTFYTLDALSGDVIAHVDVEAAAANIGWSRSGLPYDNALVANAVGFNPRAFTVLESVHPAAASVTRYYIGDTHGRFWKILTDSPNVAIPVADVGEDQPIGTAASVLGMPPYPDTPTPYVFVSSGNDSRVEEGPFRSFAFEDRGTDTQDSVTGSTTTDGVEVFAPVSLLFAQDFAQGDPEAECGYTEEAWFRGTVQPATAFECPSGATGVITCTPLLGRVFLAGTRLSEPNTRYAPPTPYACGGPFYPCRSQFDSIIYALGATTGLAAYDLGSGAGDEAYRIFRDSRLVALGMQGDPDPGRGGSSFTADEGLVKSVPKPPPPPGVPPQTTTATASVTMAREDGQPPPSVYYGSTVCQ